MNNNIIICGDSWMSPRVHVPETHFSEIFAKHFNYNLVSYARAAMSNGGILLQIEEAIKQKPKLILVGTTYPDRIEFTSSNEFVERSEMEEVTLKDLCYGAGGTDLSCLSLSNLKGSLKSEALLQFIVDSFFNGAALEPLQTDEQHDKLKAIKMYFRHLYHPTWKEKLDANMMYGILHKLHMSNIPYVICFHALEQILTKDDLFWLEDKHIFWPKFIRSRGQPNPDPGYHTSIEVQKEIADILIEHYQKYFESGSSN